MCTESRSIQVICSGVRFNFSPGMPSSLDGSISQILFTDSPTLAAGSLLDSKSCVSPEVVEKGGFLSTGNRLLQYLRDKRGHVT